VMCEINW